MRLDEIDNKYQGVSSINFQVHGPENSTKFNFLLLVTRAKPQGKTSARSISRFFTHHQSANVAVVKTIVFFSRTKF